MEPINKPFYFIRHGETDWNLRCVCMGSQDIPLNQTGIKQAESAGLNLKNHPTVKNHAIAHIATSPLSRARQTAKIIASILGSPITVIDELKEFGFGIKEGKPIEPGAFADRWLANKVPEGAEGLEAFQIRVMRGLAKVSLLQAPVLLVSHGGVYCAIQKEFGWSLNKLKNCAAIYHEPPRQKGDPWVINALNHDSFVAL